MTLLRDADNDVATIADLVRGDPALTADIIRVSNSAYYGASLPVNSVEHALQKIGYREARHLLTLTVSRAVMRQNLHVYSIRAEDFWQESLFHGCFLEELARITGAVDPSEAYTAGLLRYLGRLAINQAIQDMGSGLFWAGTETLSAWEKANLGLTHAEAGAMLLRRWKFPEELVEACAGQETPALLPAPNWLASALFFTASVLPQGFAQPFSPVLAPIMDTDFLHPNQLTSESVTQAFATTCRAYEQIRASFD